MKKALLALLSAVLVITAVQPVQAQDQRVLAIIDTAINSAKHPSVIYEACFTTGNITGCPNGTNTMEGPGSAGTKVWPTDMGTGGTYHGDAMVKSALAVNPNVKIVFVRVSDISLTTGNSVNTQEALAKAIAWVANNADKHSIDAVSISQASISTDNLRRCSAPTLPIDVAASNAISSLSAKNIPTFVSTGNQGSTTVIGYPSCIPNATAVAAIVSSGVWEKSSNKGPGVDVVAVGKTDITRYNGSTISIYGTSPATAKAAARFVGKNTTDSFSGYLNTLAKTVMSGLSYPFASN